MIIHTLKNGDEVHFFDSTIAIPFKGKRKVLSTTAHNGGYHEDIETIYNNDGRFGLGVACEMRGNNLAEHEAAIMTDLGFDVETTMGMGTAAHMENVSIKEKTYGDMTVTAIVTGGIEVNGGRVGDPAEHIGGEEKEDLTVGTINIILYYNVDLPPGTLVRALVTCTEAKTAALQELQAPSRFSRGIATGSGTDGTIIVADMESKKLYRDVGKHSKLGELTGLAVKEAVKEALDLQTCLNEKSQYNSLKRLERFGLIENHVFKYYKENYEAKLKRPKFSEYLEKIVKSRDNLILSTLTSHLIDEMDWNLISIEDALIGINKLLKNYSQEKKLEYDDLTIEKETKDQAVEEIMTAWKALLVKEVLSQRKAD